MAEEEGFEPSRPFKVLLAFQASPFSHLGILPHAFKLYTIVIKVKITISLIAVARTQLQS